MVRNYGSRIFNQTALYGTLAAWQEEQMNPSFNRNGPQMVFCILFQIEAAGGIYTDWMETMLNLYAR